MHVAGIWAHGYGLVGSVEVSYVSRPEEVLKAHARGSDGGSSCERHQS